MEVSPTIKHLMKLEGDAARGASIPLPVLAALSAALLDSAQRVVLLRIEGRSNLHASPRWLASVMQIELVGFATGSTVLEWAAPSLGAAAPDLFAALDLWEGRPRPDDTALTLLEEALRDASAGNAQSDLLDRSLLDSFSKFGRVLEMGVDRVSLNGSGGNASPAVITNEALSVVRRLKRGAPPNKRVIVTGLLDQLTASARAFKLRMQGGHSIRGVLPNGNLGDYGHLWGRKVTVDGTATFHLSGSVAYVEASHIQPAAHKDTVWEQLPRAATRSVEEVALTNPLPPGGRGFARIKGRWPGGETDEEIASILAEMS